MAIFSFTVTLPINASERPAPNFVARRFLTPMADCEAADHPCFARRPAANTKNAARCSGVAGLRQLECKPSPSTEVVASAFWPFTNGTGAEGLGLHSNWRKPATPEQ